MESNLSFVSIAALFTAMFIGASLPTLSGLTVLARSATSGFSHGALTALGIVAGDIIFILIAIYGLSFLAETLGELFVIVKYVGGAYLIWLGATLLRSKQQSNSSTADVDNVVESSLLASFLTGLFITLVDLKAILFYLGFLPAFIDMSTVSIADTTTILVVAAIAVGGPKLGYAFAADRASLLFKSDKTKKAINITAGSVMMAIGVFLLVSASTFIHL